MLREHNLRTGRYTSPHLQQVTERISVDGSPVSAQDFADTWEEIATMVAMVDGRLAKEGGSPMTYFEVLTAMAYVIFADAPVDVAVVEVGLGGQWDATNVADAAVSVVTPISLDHTEMLGGTVAEIAAEKAGIFREDSQIVLAAQPADALQVLTRKASDLNATLAVEGIDYALEHRQIAVGGQTVTVRGRAATYTGVYLPLHGRHQAHNAATAVAAVEAFLGGGCRPISGEILSMAMESVTVPGRLELVRTSPAVFLDAAHNTAGVQATVAALTESTDLQRIVGVVGILAGKPAEAMLAELEPTLAEVVITASGSPRAVPVPELAGLARQVFGEDRVHEVPRLDDAIQVAVDRAEAAGGHGSGVLVTGSVTVAGQARVLLRAAPVDPVDDSVRAVDIDLAAELGEDVIDLTEC